MAFSRYKRIIVALLFLIVFTIGTGIVVTIARKNARQSDDKSSLSVSNEIIASEYSQIPPYEFYETTQEFFADNENMSDYTTVSLSAEDIKKGSLILVNSVYGYERPEAEVLNEVVTFPYKKGASYRVVDFSDLKVREELISPLDNLMDAFEEYSKQEYAAVTVTTGFRTAEKQKELFDKKLVNDDVGFSEHQTGYCFDVKLIDSANNISVFDGTGQYSWIYDNCTNYGFILRYTADKESLTNMPAESYHFRYVGMPHSFIMSEENICLEEYIEYVKDYPFNGQHISKIVNGIEYEVYYVESAGENTDVPVPIEGQYQISGNNGDGFIVTVTKTAAGTETSAVSTDTAADTSITSVSDTALNTDVSYSG